MSKSYWIMCGRWRGHFLRPSPSEYGFLTVSAAPIEEVPGVWPFCRSSEYVPVCGGFATINEAHNFIQKYAPKGWSLFWSGR